MTQAELDALPTMGGFGMEQRVIDGKTVNVPVMEPVYVLWTEPDEPCAVVDSDGTRWRIGWYQGTRYKVRSYGGLG
jgi:hypothetical protein